MAQMRRLFVEPPSAAATAPDPAAPLGLDAEEAHYATRVLRLAHGDAVVALDGRGREAKASLHLGGRRDAPALTLLGPWTPGPALRARAELTVLLPLPKGERADWAVEKLSELGCLALVFVRTHYSQGGAGGGSAGQRLDRLARVARAAARQARHGRPPQLAAQEVPLAAALATRPAGPGYVAHPGDGARSLAQTLATASRGAAAGNASASGSPTSTTLLLGPEGGLTAEEVAAAERAGLRPVTLGPHVLRLETAAVLAAGTWVQLSA